MVILPQFIAPISRGDSYVAYPRPYFHSCVSAFAADTKPAAPELSARFGEASSSNLRRLYVYSSSPLTRVELSLAGDEDWPAMKLKSLAPVEGKYVYSTEGRLKAVEGRQFKVRARFDGRVEMSELLKVKGDDGDLADETNRKRRIR